jgi:hypothetical protein
MSTSSIENTFGVEDDPDRTSSASRFSFAANVSHFTGSLDINWGLYLNQLTLQSELGGAFQNVALDKQNVLEVGGYLETELGSGTSTRFQPGIRLSSFPSNSISFIEPRVRFVQDLGVHRFSAAAGYYHQEVVGLTDRRDAGDVFTAWTASPRGQIPEALHVIAGYQIRPFRSLRIAVEGYYKKLTNLTIARWSAFPAFRTSFQQADGTVRGFDSRLEVTAGPFYGFVNYGYSEVEYVAKQEEILFWFGSRNLTFSPPHDRRHQVNAVGSLTLYGFTLGVRFQFGSGLPFSRALGFDEFILMDGPTDVFAEEGSTRVLYGQPFDGRLPAYHRLDVSLDKVIGLVGAAELTVQAGLTNAYDRVNLFYVDLFTLRRLNQLPLIPSVGVKLEF